MPNLPLKVVPLTVTDRFVPVILMVVTRPPHLPYPSRLVIWTRFAVPTPKALPSRDAEMVLLQVWDLIKPSYGSFCAIW